MQNPQGPHPFTSFPSSRHPAPLILATPPVPALGGTVPGG